MTRSRQSRTAAGTTQLPLGSLTQRDNRPGVSCAECGSERVTRLSMKLTDGTPVQFTSCHQCAHRSWESDGATLTRDHVLARSQKTA
jgi:hypothetical protein